MSMEQSDKERLKLKRRRKLVADNLKKFRPQVISDGTEYKRTKIHLRDINYYDSDDY